MTDGTKRMRFYLFDKIILAYVALTTIFIFIFGRPLNEYLDELLLNLIFVLVVLGAVRYLDNEKVKWQYILRLLYPAILFTFFYRQTQGYIFMIFPNFFDYQLAGFEKALLGVHPTFWIEQHVLSVPLTELLSFTYAAYYPMIPVFLIWVFIKGDYEVIIKALAAICLTFFSSYLLFFLYPIEGPRYHFSGLYEHAIHGPVFRSFVEFVQRTGSVHGGCMPSSHVGVTLVITIFCLKYYRRAGILLLFITSGMMLGTFYGRYHYVSDVIVGAAIGLVMTWIVLRKKGPITADRGITEKQTKENIESVS